MDKINIDKGEDKDDEYKEDNSEAPKNDEIVINKTESEEALTGHFMIMNFPTKVIQYVIVTVSLCR